MWVGQSLNSSVLRKCSVLCLSWHRNFSVDLWIVRSGPWTLYTHGSAHTQQVNFFSDQIYLYRNKFFQMCWTNYICCFHWLCQALCENRKKSFHRPGTVSGQSCSGSAKPLGFWFGCAVSYWVLQVSSFEVTPLSEVLRISKNQSYRSYYSTGRESNFSPGFSILSKGL